MRRIHSAVTSELHAHGFRRRGSHWTRDAGELRWLVQLERGSWNSANDVTFRPYFAVLVPVLDEVFGAEGSRRAERYSSGVVYGNFAELGPRRLRFIYRRSPAYEVRSDDAACCDDIERQLRVQLDEDVLPFLHRFQSTADVVDFLSSSNRHQTLEPAKTMRLAYLAALHALAGRTGAALTVLSDLESRLGDSPSITWGERIDRIRRIADERTIDRPHS